MAMSITQDTFDEVVKENMEDFGMDREAAAGDAVEQFKAQGKVGTITFSKRQQYDSSGSSVEV